MSARLIDAFEARMWLEFIAEGHVEDVRGLAADLRCEPTVESVEATLQLLLEAS